SVDTTRLPRQGSRRTRGLRRRRLTQFERGGSTCIESSNVYSFVSLVVFPAASKGRTPDEQLRILLISTQFPCPPRSGFTMRVYQLALQLASRHDVTLLSYIDPAARGDANGFRDALRTEVVEYRWRSGAAKRGIQIASLASRRPF